MDLSWGRVGFLPHPQVFGAPLVFVLPILVFPVCKMGYNNLHPLRLSDTSSRLCDTCNHQSLKRWKLIHEFDVVQLASDSRFSPVWLAAPELPTWINFSHYHNLTQDCYSLMEDQKSEFGNCCLRALMFYCSFWRPIFKKQTICAGESQSREMMSCPF